MAYVKHTTRLLPSIKTFLPKIPTQSFHRLNSRTPIPFQKPAGFLPLEQRSAVYYATAQNHESPKSNRPFFWSATSLFAICSAIAAYKFAETFDFTKMFTVKKTDTEPAKSENPMITARLICNDIQKSIPTKSIPEIETLLSKDCFPNEESFAHHVIVFQQSAKNARQPLSAAFGTYSAARERILELSQSKKPVTTFYENFNSLTCLPPEISKLKDLTTLSLRGTSIGSLPESFGELASLESLEIYGAQFQALPSAITKLPNLKNLFCTNCGLESIPSDIGNLHQLKNLELHQNKIANIPVKFADLTALETVDLSQNCLVEFPSALTHLPQITSINLNDNQIDSIPESIKNCLALKTLRLTSNKIDVIPDQIGDLTALESLFLGKNQIKELSSTIANCKKLKNLNLSWNPIETIDVAFAALPFTYLNLSFTKIKTLPDQIRSKPRLILDIYKTPMRRNLLEEGTTVYN